MNVVHVDTNKIGYSFDEVDDERNIATIISPPERKFSTHSTITVNWFKNEETGEYMVDLFTGNGFNIPLTGKSVEELQNVLVKVVKNEGMFKSILPFIKKENSK